MTKPIVNITNPLKECVAIIGMRQEGKTNCLKYMLNFNPNPYLVFDTLGQVSLGLRPIHPRRQKIFIPNWHMREQQFNDVCGKVWNTGNMIFAIDEVHLFCTKYTMPENLALLVNQGGNRNIALWITTQRVAQVHNDLLAACKHHFIFRTYLPQDVQWYSKVVPKDIILLSKDLPPYHFIYYRLGEKPVIMKPVKKMW